MSRQKMLINATNDERRIAILEKNTLNDLLIEHRTSGQIKGNIYRGVVVKVQTSIQAAFVDFGEEKNGFLALSDLNFSLFPPLRNATPATRNSIQGRLKVGTRVVAQVTRDAIDHKGASLSTDISLPGRFMVYLPNSDQGGVSKKIEDQEERQRLKDFISGIDSEDDSVIIRTAGVGRSLAELKKDYLMLKRLWTVVQKEMRTSNNPGLILEEEDIVLRALRDYYTEDIGEIWVDDPNVFQNALNFMKTAMPRRQKDLKLFVGDRSLFSAYGIEREVEQLTDRQVPLRSGGSLAIDQTEALVAVDVNSGRSSRGVSIEETAFQTNMEAAKEVARQLRLRNMGGLVVVDFIDMEDKAHQKEVEGVIIEAMETDRAQHTIGEISQFGLLELSRQRLATGISRTIHNACPTCEGKGKIPSLFASANSILRIIRNKAALGNLEVFEANVPIETANYLLNEKREELSDLELEFGIRIKLNARSDIHVFNDDTIQITKTVEVGVQAPEIEIDEDTSSQYKKKPLKKESVNTLKKEIVNTKKVEVKVEAPKAVIEKTKPVKEKPKLSAEEKFQEAINPDTKLFIGCRFKQVSMPPEETINNLIESFKLRASGKSPDNKTMFYNERFLWEPSSANIASKHFNFVEGERSINLDLPSLLLAKKEADAQAKEDVQLEMFESKSQEQENSSEAKVVETVHEEIFEEEGGKSSSKRPAAKKTTRKKEANQTSTSEVKEKKPQKKVASKSKQLSITEDAAESTVETVEKKTPVKKVKPAGKTTSSKTKKAVSAKKEESVTSDEKTLKKAPVKKSAKAKKTAETSDKEVKDSKQVDAV